MHKQRLVVLALVLVASLLVACGGSTSKSTSTPSGNGAATAGATTASGAATVIATTVTGGKANGICAKIPQADAQALTPQPLQPVTDTGIGECLFHDAVGDVKVDYYVNDADQQYYKTLSSSGDQQLAGVGDEAYWNEPVSGKTPPFLAAHKGNETCTILSNDPPDTTLKYTGTEPFITVTDDDALAYVQLMGKVCTDVFATQ